jgi:hypothetical protein
MIVRRGVPKYPYREVLEECNGKPCFLEQDMFVVGYLHVPCTRKERFRHVSNRSRYMRCPKEEGNDQVDDCGSIHTQGPSSSSSFYRFSISPGAFLDFLLCSRLFIPSAKIIHFPLLISWGFISKCSWWKVTSSEDVSRDSRKQLHSRKRRIIGKSARLQHLSGSLR